MSNGRAKEKVHRLSVLLERAARDVADDREEAITRLALEVLLKAQQRRDCATSAASANLNSASVDGGRRQRREHELRLQRAICQ